MSQMLDLSKRFSQEQIEEANSNNSQYEEVKAGGYVCKIVDAILNDDNASDKHNIELHLDIEEGNLKGYFQGLEDRAGFWGLRGYLSFKESQLDRFLRACTSINTSNPGYSFDPMRKGGADVDTLKGKLIGVIVQKEEYRAKDGDIREKCSVYGFLDVERIRKGKFKTPDLKKFQGGTQSEEFINIPEGTDEEVPFN